MGVLSNARVGVLTAVPSLCALAGAWLDERTHLGFTNWRSACRASGLSLRSLTFFTVELLPGAIAGALLGGLAVLSVGFALRHRDGIARGCVAAHAGCAFAMPAGLVLCALLLPLSLPVGLLLAMDLMLAALISVSWLRLFPGHLNLVAPHP